MVDRGGLDERLKQGLAMVSLEVSVKEGGCIHFCQSVGVQVELARYIWRYVPLLTILCMYPFNSKAKLSNECRRWYK